MSGLVEAVRDEHVQIMEATDRLVEKYASWPLGEHSAKKALHTLVAMLSRHETAEARVLWPAARDLLRERDELRARARRQERDARWLLHRLRKSAGTKESVPLVVDAVRAVREHVAFEEGRILFELDQVISLNESMSLGLLFEACSAAAPTRPHPLTPAIPGVLALIGPLARRTDRVLDLLRIG